MREGEHSACWQNARWNTIPRAASASRFGDFTIVSP